MPQTQTFDVIVLGAGAVGENVADRASRTGLSVAVVERGLVGGECSYWACMPSKVLLRPGAVLAGARAVPGLVVEGHLDPPALFARRDEIVHDWDDDSQAAWVEGAGLTLLRGQGRIVAERSVEVDDGLTTSTLTARCAVVVATGSEPVLPELPGLADVAPWTSHDATALREVPASVVVVGGGVVACEMATVLADLGSSVTLLVRGERLLSGTEPFVGEALAASLAAMGVTVRTRTQPVAVAPDGDGVRVDVADGEPLRAQHLLVATGRRPRTAGLGLESLGLDPDKPLRVDDSGRVFDLAAGWLYAAGDVTGRTNTTHQGKYDARVVGDVIAHRFAPGTEADPTADADDWSRFRSTADRAAVPQVVFTRPEVATVGLTEAAARAAGIDVRTVTLSFDTAAGSVFSTQEPGTAHLVVDQARRIVVGATFVGPEVAEMLHAATIAVVGQVPLERLWHAVPAYPTRSEVWLRLLESLGL